MRKVRLGLFLLVGFLIGVGAWGQNIVNCDPADIIFDPFRVDTTALQSTVCTGPAAYHFTADNSGRVHSRMDMGSNVFHIWSEGSGGWSLTATKFSSPKRLCTNKKYAFRAMVKWRGVGELARANTHLRDTRILMGRMAWIEDHSHVVSVFDSGVEDATTISGDGEWQLVEYKFYVGGVYKQSTPGHMPDVNISKLLYMPRIWQNGGGGEIMIRDMELYEVDTTLEIRVRPLLRKASAQLNALLLTEEINPYINLPSIFCPNDPYGSPLLMPASLDDSAVYAVGLLPHSWHITPSGSDSLTAGVRRERVAGAGVRQYIYVRDRRGTKFLLKPGQPFMVTPNAVYEFTAIVAGRGIGLTPPVISKGMFMSLDMQYYQQDACRGLPLNFSAVTTVPSSHKTVRLEGDFNWRRVTIRYKVPRSLPDSSLRPVLIPAFEGDSGSGGGELFILKASLQRVDGPGVDQPVDTSYTNPSGPIIASVSSPNIKLSDNDPTQLIGMQAPIPTGTWPGLFLPVHAQDMNAGWRVVKDSTVSMQVNDTPFPCLTLSADGRLPSVIWNLQPDAKNTIGKLHGLLRIGNGSWTMYVRVRKVKGVIVRPRLHFFDAHYSELTDSSSPNAAPAITYDGAAAAWDSSQAITSWHTVALRFTVPTQVSTTASFVSWVRPEIVIVAKRISSYTVNPNKQVCFLSQPELIEADVPADSVPAVADNATPVFPPILPTEDGYRPLPPGYGFECGNWHHPRKTGIYLGVEQDQNLGKYAMAIRSYQSEDWILFSNNLSTNVLHSGPIYFRIKAYVRSFDRPVNPIKFRVSLLLKGRKINNVTNDTTDISGQILVDNIVLNSNNEIIIPYPEINMFYRSIITSYEFTISAHEGEYFISSISLASNNNPDTQDLAFQSGPLKYDIPGNETLLGGTQAAWRRSDWQAHRREIAVDNFQNSPLVGPGPSSYVSPDWLYWMVSAAAGTPYHTKASPRGIYQTGDSVCWMFNPATLSAARSWQKLADLTGWTAAAQIDIPVVDELGSIKAYARLENDHSAVPAKYPRACFLPATAGYYELHADVRVPSDTSYTAWVHSGVWVRDEIILERDSAGLNPPYQPYTGYLVKRNEGERFPHFGGMHDGGLTGYYCTGPGDIMNSHYRGLDIDMRTVSAAACRPLFYNIAKTTATSLNKELPDSAGLPSYYASWLSRLATDLPYTRDLCNSSGNVSVNAAPFNGVIEIWNEPGNEGAIRYENGDFNCKPFVSMMSASRHAFQHHKALSGDSAKLLALDMEAISGYDLLNCTESAPISTTDGTLPPMRGLDLYDIVSPHPYTQIDYLRPVGPENYGTLLRDPSSTWSNYRFASTIQQLAQYRNIAQYGLSTYRRPSPTLQCSDTIAIRPLAKPKLLWSTEFGWPTHPDPYYKMTVSPFRQALFTVRSALLQHAMGFEMIIPWTYADQAPSAGLDFINSFGLADSEYKPKPAQPAFFTAALLTGQKPYLGKLVSDRMLAYGEDATCDSYMGLAWGQNHDCLIALWQTGGGSCSLFLPMVEGTWRMLDMMGRQVGEERFYSNGDLVYASRLGDLADTLNAHRLLYLVSADVSASGWFSAQHHLYQGLSSASRSYSLLPSGQLPEREDVSRDAEE